MLGLIVPSLILSLIVPVAGETPAASDLMDLLPAEAEFPGWVLGKERIVPTARALYDYMDGGAEIYLDYGFQELGVAEWESPDGHPLKIELYRLSRPKSAYGLFTYETWAEKVDLGQGATYEAGTLRFWKGDYFVRIFMWTGYKEHGPTILEMGRSIARRIETPGEVPALVSLLPGEGRVEGGLHFFHTALVLGGFYYLSDGNPLGLSRETDGVIGEYLTDDEETVYLLLVSYPDSATAEKAYEGLLREEGFAAQVAAVGERSAALEYDDGLWRTVALQGAYLVLALDCPAGKTCEGLVKKAARNLEPTPKSRAKGDGPCSKRTD